MSWVVGLDLGGTKVHGILFDGAAARASTRFPTARGPQGIIASAARAVEELCAAHGVLPTELVGVGIGVPGVVDADAGTVSHAVNLGLSEPGLPLAALLTARIGAPVRVENDLSVATLGAAHVFGTDDVALLSLGTGIAAGLLLGGRLRRGFRGAAGEIGHLPYIAGGRPCRCGQRGCFEMYGSGAALAAEWPAPRSAQSVFATAAAGDPHAVTVRDDYVRAVAAAITVLALTCDVERILLGGGVADVGVPLLEAVASRLRDEARSSDFLTHLDIADRLGIVPTDAQVAPIGAALAALQSVEISPVPSP